MQWLDTLIANIKQTSWVAQRFETYRLKRERRRLEITILRFNQTLVQANNIVARRFIPAMTALNEAMASAMDSMSDGKKK